MSEQRIVHLVVALMFGQIEILEFGFLPPPTLWLDGCAAVLFEAHQLEFWENAKSCQLELVQYMWGVFEVRCLELE